ncbi:phage protein [Helicobacter cinaedi]|uniref:Phage protein n=1 Tax=Helicobacter cinaedi TaxID=213 RepID=A0A377JUW5_9HELI|nr:phage protein [Helicobacter cinaedi]
MSKKSIKNEIILRTLAQKDLYSFVKLKWERYNNAPFMEGWHIQYLCKILESTLPCNDLTSGNHLRDCANFETTADFMSSSASKLAQNSQSNTANLNHTQNPNPTHKHEVADSRLRHDLKRVKIKSHEVQTYESVVGVGVLQGGGSDFACSEANPHLQIQAPPPCKKENTSNDFSKKDNAKAKTSPSTLITRLMINMPPSYGKTEIIARSFIAWALGKDRKRKFFYISYSDELCRKIANQVRDLLKSKLWSDVFLSPPQFLQDNAQEFVLREGADYL